MDKIDPTGGRKALQELLATQSQRTQKLAWQVAKETAAAIQSGTSAAQAVSTAMDRVGMAQAVRGNVAEAVVQSLCIGSGIWPKVEGHADIGRLKDIALQHTWDDSGMTLSTRLHGTNAAMRADIVGAVNSLVQSKDNAWQASRKIYDGYGLGGAINRAKLSDLPGDLTTLLERAQGTLAPESLADLKLRAKQLSAYADRLATGPLRASYQQFASRLEKGLTMGLDKLVKTATEEKARYHADRILRTEAARAWGQGFAKQCADDPDVIGWRWETSSAHKIFDICDFHARADLYGMGPGVYPKAHHPSYPAHPHCLCNASMVFKGEAPAPSDQVTKGGKDAIAGMTEAERVRILGKPGAQAFRGGADWKASIKLWEPPAGAMLSKGAVAVLESVQGTHPALERSASEAIKRVDQIVARVDALERGKRSISKERAEAIQKSIERALAVEYPAKITMNSGMISAAQKDGVTRLSKIFSARAVPNGIVFDPVQIPSRSTSSHHSWMVQNWALRTGLWTQPSPAHVPNRIKIRRDAPPEIMAHELLHAADDQNPKLFEEIAKERAKGPVSDVMHHGRGYANKVYQWGQTEYLTMGAQNVLEDAVRFRRSDPDHFKRTIELLRGEWVAR